MGAWGTGAFENDDALDFVADVIGGAGLELIEAALTSALHAGDDFLEAPEGEEVLAAASILALIKDHSRIDDTTPEDLTAWLAAAPSPSADLLETARQAVARVVTEPSELLDLWGDTEELEAWKAAVSALSTKL